MNSNFFFKKKKLKLSSVFDNLKFNKNFEINDIKPLHLANFNDLTFFDSIKYKNYAVNTNAGVCITKKNLEKYLPTKTQKIITNNVLLELAKTSQSTLQKS